MLTLIAITVPSSRPLGAILCFLLGSGQRALRGLTGASIPPDILESDMPPCTRIPNHALKGRNGGTRRGGSACRTLLADTGHEHNRDTGTTR